MKSGAVVFALRDEGEPYGGPSEEIRLYLHFLHVRNIVLAPGKFLSEIFTRIAIRAIQTSRKYSRRARQYSRWRAEIFKFHSRKRHSAPCSRGYAGC